MNEIFPSVLVYADLHEFEGDVPNSYKQEWESSGSVDQILKLLNELGETAELVTTPQDLLEKLNLYSSLEISKRPVLFHLMEGFRSRNRESLIPAVAELFGFAHTGSDAYAQAVSLDKNLTRNFASSLGLPVAPGILISSLDKNDVNISEKMNFPCFLKPAGEGSSLGIGETSFVVSQDDLISKLKLLKEEYVPYLLEEYLSGEEYTIAVMGSHTTGYQVSKPGRLILQEDLKVEEVYGEKTKSKNSMPERLIFDCLQPLERFLQERSLLLCNAIGTAGPARLDWKLNGNGDPFFLEINLTPGLSPFYSTFPICYRHGLGDEKSLFLEILNIARLELQNPRFLYSKTKKNFVPAKK
ncbi:D-alanine--D-alanine ligase [Leptospira sp. WS92.C1]